MSRRSPFLALELRIAADERGGIMHRWEYGRELNKKKTGRQRLPKGMLGDLVAAAERAGLKLSEREIQYRLKCADVYATERVMRSAAAAMGSWRALCDAGFPPFEDDEPELPLDLDETPDAWQPEQLTIPGVPVEIKLRGRPALPLGEATVREFRAYCEQSAEMTASFAKRDAQLREALDAMEDGCGGDDDANALDAWKRGVGLEDDEERAE